MYIPLSIIVAVTSVVLAVVSFLLLMLFSENPRRNVAIWLILTIIGILGFFISIIWLLFASVL